MEIRQVLKSSASITPVLFYKVSDGQNKTRREEEIQRSGRGSEGKPLRN